MRYFTAFLALFLLALPAPSRAEDTADPTFALTLREYNQVNPKQSDLYIRGSRLSKGRILDSQNRTLGDIEDIVVNSSGSIESLQTSLNRLPGGRGTDLALDYSALDILPVNGGYRLNQTGTQLSEMMPQLLSNIATAAGPESGNLSVQNLIGSDVKSENGARIGKVEDVIFERNGSHAHSLLVRVNYKAVRGESIAIPLDIAQYETQGRKLNVVLSSTDAQTLVDFAK